jgi:hypothetical protein
VKNPPLKARRRSSASSTAKKLRVLKKYVRELQALYAEAIKILEGLLINPSIDAARKLCARFHVLQEYFALRYHEAKAFAISTLGKVEAALSFP